MNREILWDPAAWADVEEAFEEYAEGNRPAAEAFRDELDAAVESLAASGEERPVFDEGVRRCLLKHYPFGLLYTLDEEHVAILALMHANRLPG